MISLLLTQVAAEKILEETLICPPKAIAKILIKPSMVHILYGDKNVTGVISDTAIISNIIDNIIKKIIFIIHINMYTEKRLNILSFNNLIISFDKTYQL